MFQIDISLTDSEAHTIFSNPTVFIEITDTTNSNTDPRARFSVTPFALKIPVDGSSLTYDASGVLSAATAADCNPGEYLDGDGICYAIPTDTDTNTNADTICASGKFLGGGGDGCLTVPVDSHAGTKCDAGQYLDGDGSALTNVVGIPAGSSNQIQFSNAGVTGANPSFVWNNGTGHLGIGTTFPNARLDVTNSSPSTTAITAKGASGKTANLQEWQNDAGVPLAHIDKDGVLVSKKICPPSFTMITAAGHDQGCMQDSEQGSDTWWDAVETCKNTHGGELPDVQTWYHAMSNHTFAGEIGAAEWTSETYTTTANTIGSTTLQTLSFSNMIIGTEYRCYIPAANL